MIEELCQAGSSTTGASLRRRRACSRSAERATSAIRFELERAGVDPVEIEQALASLEPERERAEALVSRRGATLATARLLAGRGFDAELVAALVAPGQ